MIKILNSTILFLIIIVPILAINASVAYADIIIDGIKGLGGQSGLPSYETVQHGEAPVEEGVAEITSVIYFIIDFLKYALGSIAVLMIIISSVRLVIGGEEEEMVKQKNSMMWSIGGLVLVILADVVVKKVFFGESGEAFSSEGDAKLFATEGMAQIKGIYNFIEIFVASVAVASIIYAAIRILTSGGEEDVITKHKTHIYYALFGLVLIGMAEFAVKEVIFPDQGKSLPNADKAKLLIKNITNFMSGFIAIAAILMYIYGGYLYVITGVEDENMNNAKKVLINATIGILIAGGAYGIVNTLIKFEAPIDVNVANEQMPPPTLPPELE